MKQLLFLPSVVAVALAGATIYLAQQLGSERARAREAEGRVTELESQLKNADRARMAARAEISEARAAVASSSSPSPSGPAKNTQPVEKDKDPQQPVMMEENWQQRMWKSPSSRALLREERIARLREENPELARALGISDAEAQDLLAFLADQELRRQQDFARRRASGDFNFQAELERNRRELAAKLGDERMRRYEAYKEGAPDRALVRTFRARLGESDTLTDAQAQSLATALQEEREQYAKELKVQIGDAATFVWGSAAQTGRFLATNVPRSDEDAQEQQIIDQMEMYTRRANERAATLLTPGQLKVFEEHQAAQLVRGRMNLRSMRETIPKK